MNLYLDTYFSFSSPEPIEPRAIRVFETNLHIRAPFTKWEPGMPVALGDQLRRPRLK